MDLTPEDEMEQEFIGTPQGEAWLNAVDQIREGKEMIEMPTAFLLFLHPDFENLNSHPALLKLREELAKKHGVTEQGREAPPESEDEPF